MPIEHSPTRQKEEDTKTSNLSPIGEPANFNLGTMNTGGGGGPPDGNISAAQTVRLPPFWKDNPALWFAQVEAAFAIHRITGDDSKFRYVVLHVDQSVLPLVADLIANPPAQDKYSTLKERICTVLGETSATNIRKLLGSHEIGDEKPSIFLQRLRNLAAGQVTDDILKSIFMEQLPENVRTILEISEVQDLAKLAAQADKIIEMARPSSSTIQAVSGGQNNSDKLLKEIVELKQQVKKLALRDRQRSGSRGRTPSRGRAKQRGNNDSNKSSEYCYYHNKFGDKAFKCTPPCSYDKTKSLEN
ncbi:uncharacterized protein LOC113003955 [Solenopsis invicta]|uniref:uncharacterized protein LOC113003955 n=1 Tax=Solenopsis invicta TaxID=13686 RepID=UPI000E33F1F1|nr:uncharacterized protein LOC113003955 [Solenopsis invicta]